MIKATLNSFRGIFGSRNQRLLKGYGRLVKAINALESEFKDLSDEDLSSITAELKSQYVTDGDLEALLPQAFAAVREASRRTLRLRHFDVQLIGGIVLHVGKIAEMRTGEGKTLAATLPAYLNALTGRGVHIVTVNDYLAQRDADWMGPIYRFLGMEVGVVKSGQTPDDKRRAYEADITYGTNNEFGFDYLRDNLALRKEDRAQRELAFAIVDEVDSILIDEARTPLIISGRSEESTELYVKVNHLVPKLKLHSPPAGAANEEVEAAINVFVAGRWLSSGENVRKFEIKWFYQIGCSLIFPDVWEKYKSVIPNKEQNNFLKAYYKRLTSKNYKTRTDYRGI